jgi:hypothetical protein
MKLTPAELLWIDERLNSYGIKYQEIYNEIKDHLLTAIEIARAEGDSRGIDAVFEEVVRKQFPGYWPFDDIVKQYLAAYRQKISRSMWRNYKHYINWQTIPLILLLLISSFYLPHTKPVLAVLFIVLLITAIVPIFYVLIKARDIVTEKGKQLLVKSYVTSRSYSLLWIFSIVFNILAPISREWHQVAFLNPLNYPMAIFMLMLCFYVVYSLSCMRLCRQEFKIE